MYGQMCSRKAGLSQSLPEVLTTPPEKAWPGSHQRVSGREGKGLYFRKDTLEVDPLEVERR